MTSLTDPLHKNFSAAYLANRATLCVFIWSKMSNLLQNFPLLNSTLCFCLSLSVCCAGGSTSALISVESVSTKRLITSIPEPAVRSWTRARTHTQTRLHACMRTYVNHTRMRNQENIFIGMLEDKPGIYCHILPIWPWNMNAANLCYDS